MLYVFADSRQFLRLFYKSRGVTVVRVATTRSRDASCRCAGTVKQPPEHGGSRARTVQAAASAAVAAAAAAAAARRTRVQWTASPSGDENV